MSEPFNKLMRGLDPDQRRRIANALMANQYDRPTPQDGPVTERAGLFPLGTYANGQTGLAWPGFVAEPVQSFYRLLQNGYQAGTGDTQGVEDAFNVAGAAMLGGLAAPRPRGSIGMGGRPQESGALPGRRPGDFPEPNQAPFAPTAAGPTVQTLSRPDHLQGRAPHTTIEDDLLPSASYAPWTVEGYNVNPKEIEATRQFLQEQFVKGAVPDGWLVHGRAQRGDLDTGNVLQGTQDTNVSLRYAGDRNGSVWAMRPHEDARVLDFTSENAPDLRRVTAQALRQYREGELPFDGDLTSKNPRFMSQQIRQSFAPESIVNSAGAFDNANWVNWLAENSKAGFVRTPDGGVAMSPEDVTAIRLFSNASAPAAGVINALLQNYYGDRER